MTRFVKMTFSSGLLNRDTHPTEAGWILVYILGQTTGTVILVYCELSRFSVRTKRSCYLFMSAAITNGIANIGILKEIFKRKRIF